MRESLGAVVILLALSAAVVVAAQEAPSNAAPAAADADGPPRASEYVIKVQDAIRRAKNRDFEGSMEALREAFRMEPSNPMAFYYAGEVDRMQANLPQALERFRTCTEFAERESVDLYHARCLQAVAETLERTDGQLEQAREAWRTYVTFADAHRTVSSPEVGRARIQAIDVQMEQAGAYVEVRQRIAAREAENARNRASSSMMSSSMSSMRRAN